MDMIFMFYVFNSPLYLIKSKFLPSTCTKTTQESLLISINSDTKKRWSLLIRVYCYCTKHKGRMRWSEYVRNDELAVDGLQASLTQTVDIHSVGSNNCFLKEGTISLIIMYYVNLYYVGFCIYSHELEISKESSKLQFLCCFSGMMSKSPRYYVRH